ncbi:putative serine O-acetyltransferase [Lentilactobacillus parafarraginis F0439]|uniref:Serine acetyltransferase n=1 Tax=Lentilactobacillus parafarraginis F0439 TaxID=797515 RepID=G9ZTT2_9LACO|nr:serine O-acetyltransferase EpsC [Lentilactobacillus parafarraginis]EHL95195.1 putative serine O-acetyltransferase [Lentilactobacillus parafarraginis F0439]
MFQTARSILKRDPAAHSLLQVILTYPGIRALFWYRIAHQLAQWHQYVLATLLSQHAAKITGITIAPEATIGKRVFIDHGVGTVIGATVIIEDDVTILHGVTLGTRRMTDQGRRHPYVRQGAFIDANAQILGPIEIGQYSKVGAGAVVLTNVPSHLTVVGNPATIVPHPTSKVVSVSFSYQATKSR